MLLSGTYDWLYDDDRWVISSEGIIDSLEFLHIIYRKQKILDDVSMAVMLGRHSTDTSARKFLSDEIGIVLFSSRLASAIERNAAGLLKDRIAIAPMPRQNGAGYTSVTGSWMLGISSLSANKFISFEFLKSALSKDVQILCSQSRGDMPVRRDALQEIESDGMNPYTAEMSDYLYFSRFRPDGTAYPQVSRQISAAVESVVTGSRTSYEAAAEFTASMKILVPENLQEERLP
jgi:multiple sugar transport system substrate-binding protein